MSKFTDLFKNIFKKAAPLTGRYYFVNGSAVWMGDQPTEYVTKGYQANDIVYSAINLVTDKARVAPWSLYKVVSDNSLKTYKALLNAGKAKEAQAMQAKALVPLTSFNTRTGKWLDLLDWVNEYETFSDFVTNGIAYKMITGNKFWWANILEAGANQGLPQELYALPSQHMQILAKTGWPVRTLGYQLSAGEIVTFPKELVLHEKFFNPEYDWQGSHLYGQSPLKAASKNLTRNNYTKASTTARFENGGMEGVLFVNDQRINPEDGLTQAAEVKKLMAKEYAGVNNAGKVGVSGYPMGYISMGQTNKDLMSLDFENMDLRRLSNIWGIPSQLLNDPENKTYNNLKEAEKAITSRCVIPHLCATRDNLNRKMQTDWGLKGENVYLDFDASVYTELQDDQAAKWQWVSQLTVPEAYKLELMGLDVPDTLPPDLILIDGNKQSLSDFLAGSAIDMTAIDQGLSKAGLNDYRDIQ